MKYFFLIFALLIPLKSWANITFIQGGKTWQTPASTTTVVSLGGVTAGNFLVAVGGADNNTTTFTSISDGTTSFTVTPSSPSSDAGAVTRTWIAYLPTANVIGGATTITFTHQSCNNSFLWVGEFSGVKAVAPLDTDAAHAAVTSSTSINDPTCTPTQSGDLFIGAALAQQTISSANVPYTGTADILNGNDWEYYIQGTAAALSINFTQAPAGRWSGMCAAFKAQSYTPVPITLIQHTQATNLASGTTVAIPVAATGAGNLLIVGTATNTARTITGVTDGTNAFTQAANAAGTDGAAHSTDVWYLLSATAGKTTITATFSGAAAVFDKEAWFWEVNGFVSPSYDVGNHVNAGVQAAGTATGGSITTTSSSDFAVAVDHTSNAVSANPKLGNEFLAGGDINVNNNAACSLYTTVAGAHQPQWTDNGTAFSSSTASFKETSFNRVKHRVSQ